MWTQTQSRTRKATDKYVIPYFKLVIIPRIVCFPVRYYSVISLRVFLFYRLNSRFYRWIVRFKAAHLEETEGRFTFAFIIISKRNLLETFLHLFEKDLILFRKLFGLFWKARCVFHVGTNCIPPPSLIRSFLLFRSSLHFNYNMQIINRLRMTEPSLILPSAVLPKSLHNLPSAFVHPKEVTLKVTGLSD